MVGMARSEPPPSIADLLDEAATTAVAGYSLKLDEYLDTLDDDTADRVRTHLRSKMSARKIALTITNDPSTPYQISATAVGNWRHRYGIEPRKQGGSGSS